MYTEEVWTNYSHPIILRWLTECKMNANVIVSELTDEIFNEIYECISVSNDLKLVTLITGNLFELFKKDKNQPIVSQLFPLYMYTYLISSEDRTSKELTDCIELFLVGVYNLVLSTGLYRRMILRVPLANVRTPFSTAGEIKSMLLNVRPPPSTHIRICTQSFAVAPARPIKSITLDSQHRNQVFTLLLAVYNQYMCQSTIPRKYICLLSNKLVSDGYQFGHRHKRRILKNDGSISGCKRFVLSDELIIQLLYALQYIIYNTDNLEDVYGSVKLIVKRCEYDLMVNSLLVSILIRAINVSQSECEKTFEVAKAVSRCFEQSSTSNRAVDVSETDQQEQATTRHRRQPAFSFTKTVTIGGRYGSLQHRPDSPTISSDTDVTGMAVDKSPPPSPIIKSNFMSQRNKRNRQSFLSPRRKSKAQTSEIESSIELSDENPGIKVENSGEHTSRRKNTREEHDDDSSIRLSANSVVRLPFLRPKAPTRITGTPMMRAMSKRRRSILYSTFSKFSRNKK